MHKHTLLRTMSLSMVVILYDMDFHEESFMDLCHLNEKGAELFSIALPTEMEAVNARSR